MANNNYKLKIGSSFYSVENVIASGSTNSNYYSGFPKYQTTNLTFEKHQTELGYKVSNTDLANNVVAFYRDHIGGGTTNTGTEQRDEQANNTSYQGFNKYGTTINQTDQTIPEWCTKMRVVVIGAGGGAKGDGYDAGSGGGGGSGGLAAGTVLKVTGTNTYSVSLGGCGRGGYYEGDDGQSGYNARSPDQISTKFTYYASEIGANVGGNGDGGVKAEANNNTSSESSGGYGFVNTTNVQTGYVTTTGNGGNAGNAYNPGESNGISNDANIPVLNTNQGEARSHDGNSNTTNGFYSIDQDNQLPGYGQGGWGGISKNENSNSNSNGYGGQCGGRSLVRVYFIR